MADEGDLGSRVGAEGAGGRERALPHPASRTGVVQGTVSSRTRAQPSLISPSVTPGSLGDTRGGAWFPRSSAGSCFQQRPVLLCHRSHCLGGLSPGRALGNAAGQPHSTLPSIICSTPGVNRGRNDPLGSTTSLL